MRITTGLYKGRSLYMPDGDAIRPTSDRMRQALFNILQSYGLPQDAVVLDAFCGSGALGIEALSRGAAQAFFMDIDTKTAAKNIASFGVQNAVVVRGDVTKAGAARAACDLVFLDPPYRRDLIVPALTALAAHGWLAPEAIVVCESEADYAGDIPADFAMLDRRDYGAARLHLLRYAG